jgi:hypothetical protein
MTIWPSVVIGLGSSGAYVVANMERILYEVLGDTGVDLFRLMVIETAQTAKDDEGPPGGIRRRWVNASETDVGQAITDLRASLGSDFDWCPRDLRIAGQGAGNIRAGGRLMLFSKYDLIRQAILDALKQTHDATRREESTQALRDQLQRRNMNLPDQLVNAREQIVYVVGTLAGGTCSGMCVDLGYLLHQENPAAKRVGIFFLPERTAPPVFQQNSWGTLKDLEYFCDHPDAFQGVWPSNGRPHRYSGLPAKPFDQVYLLSSSNQRRQPLRLEYRTSPDAPLVVMAATQLAADLMGMAALRSERLVNINTHVPGAEKRRTFLNFNLRAISYPKYEIAEAAACKVVAETVCAAWLNTDRWIAESGDTKPIKKDDLESRGRKVWNDGFGDIWRGAFANTDIVGQARHLKEVATDPRRELVDQLTREYSDTLFTKIQQHIPGQREELHDLVNRGMIDVARDTANLQCVEHYLVGLRDEVRTTLNYWKQLKTPSSKDTSAWQTIGRDLAQTVIEESKSLAGRALGAGDRLLQDGLSRALTQLTMYLMREPLINLVEWIDSDRLLWTRQMRDTLQRTSDLASQRHRLLLHRLQDESGPILKLPRSSQDTFQREIDSLAADAKAYIRRGYLTYRDRKIEGDFIVRGERQEEQGAKIFPRLRGPVQTHFLARLSRQSFDVVDQIINQERLGHAENLWQGAYDLSLATKLSMARTHTTVPSYIAAGSIHAAERLTSELRSKSVQIEVDSKALPMFDHMAVFYQEGVVMPSAESLPDELFDADVLREHFGAEVLHRADYVDPLRQMKRHSEAGHVQS